MRNFNIPELGENIKSATVVKILVAPGENIKPDQPVLELETDKATIEVPSDVAGKITAILIAEGDQVSIGQTVFTIDDTDNGTIDVNAESKAAEEVETNSPAPEEVKIPEVTENKTVENTEINAPQKHISTGVQDSSKVILVDNQPPILQQAAAAAPSVRRLAREIGVDINQVKGSGPGGRIVMDDVKAHSKALHQQSGDMQHIRAEQHYEALPDFSKFGEITTENMSNIRRKTAEHLSYAWHTIPHVTQFDKADITNLEEFRKSYSKSAEKYGVKLTVTAILVKVIASALKKFPQFNASVDMHNKTIIYKKYYNVGIAVDTEFGLIVPVIKDADKLNIIEISGKINELAEKARNKKIAPADMQGACFTITNLGGIGGTAFTPIVNAPEAAILGVSKGSFEPVYENGTFVPRLMLPLSLSYDHRLIDGADGIRFLRWVIEALENPLKLIVEG